MAENNKIYTLDERIENNLKEIYENEIVPLKEIVFVLQKRSNCATKFAVKIL